MRGTVVTQLQPTYSLPFQLSFIVPVWSSEKWIDCSTVLPRSGFIPVQFIEFKELGVRGVSLNLLGAVFSSIF
jgi:hypothetical protein